MHPTNEQINDVARAMWNSQPDDELPRWDELEDEVDGDLKHEIRVMARAGIRRWLEITTTKSG